MVENNVHLQPVFQDLRHQCILFQLPMPTQTQAAEENKENEETEKINYIAIVTGRVCWILSFIEYFRLLLVILSPPLQIHQYRL